MDLINALINGEQWGVLSLDDIVDDIIEWSTDTGEVLAKDIIERIEWYLDANDDLESRFNSPICG